MFDLAFILSAQIFISFMVKMLKIIKIKINYYKHLSFIFLIIALIASLFQAIITKFLFILIIIIIILKAIR